MCTFLLRQRQRLSQPRGDGTARQPQLVIPNGLPRLSYLWEPSNTPTRQQAAKAPRSNALSYWCTRRRWKPGWFTFNTQMSPFVHLGQPWHQNASEDRRSHVSPTKQWWGLVWVSLGEKDLLLLTPAGWRQARPWSQNPSDHVPGLPCPPATQPLSSHIREFLSCFL